MKAVKAKQWLPWALVLALTVLNVVGVFRPVVAQVSPGDIKGLQLIIGGGYGDTGLTANTDGDLEMDGDLTVGGGGAFGDDQTLTFGDDSDWSFGYDSALDAAVLVDSASNVLWKFTDLGTTAYPVAEATVSETHRATAGTTNEVANRLSLNDTNGDALTAAEWRAKWTDDTLSSETSQTSVYARNSGTLGEKLRLSGAGNLSIGGTTYSSLVAGNVVYQSNDGLVSVIGNDAADASAVNLDVVLGDNTENSLVRVFRFSTASTATQKFVVYQANTSTPVFEVYGKSGVAAPTVMYGNVLIDTTTTQGVPAFEVQQDDADEPFIAFDGTSAASAANNVSTWTTGNAIQGFIRVDVEGTDYWMPYYSAPTS